jgi:hypothetical protein
MQDRAPPRRGARDLHESEAQAETGVGLQIADCRLQIADCRLQIADCRLQIED